MRTFVDRSGRRWDVVLGHESWGALLALFVPAGTGAEYVVRQAVLDVTAYGEGAQALESLDEAALQQLLDRSVVKEG